MDLIGDDPGDDVDMQEVIDDEETIVGVIISWLLRRRKSKPRQGGRRPPRLPWDQRHGWLDLNGYGMNGC